ncbi:hypothetical protein [Bifidobacterium pseudocatenulatum]|uniref:hypothetical protein n=1 Tax=Bifidobacterium pseudocatenulatum TaxID=28026 RepID=UPI0018A990FB|nr:hypothetical protein [Bifidobacterium pseudocatenulatum]
MTKINFDFGKPSAGGIVDLSNATVSVIPTERFRNDSRIVVREGFEVALDAKGKATVTVPPTDNTFCYEVTVGLDTDLWKFRRYVNVPDSTTAVEFADLVDVDSGTLAPALNSGAALTYLLASSLSEAQAMSKANPGQMVFYPEGQAKTVASQILEDLTDARAVVEAQSAVAAQAANAAQAASDASQAASAQVTAVSDSITESKSVVESHANEALTAIDEAVKSVKDKASDVSGEDRTDAMPTDSASSQEA